MSYKDGIQMSEEMVKRCHRRRDDILGYLTSIINEMIDGDTTLHRNTDGNLTFYIFRDEFRNKIVSLNYSEATGSVNVHYGINDTTMVNFHITEDERDGVVVASSLLYKENGEPAVISNAVDISSWLAEHISDKDSEMFTRIVVGINAVSFGG